MREWKITSDTTAKSREVKFIIAISKNPDTPPKIEPPFP